jgi:uncharacterized tellurite resistance protein B-like protein
MISIIKQFFDKYVKPSEEITDAVSDHSLQLATAALLVEMMHADAKVNEDEQKTIIKSIRSKFHLTEEETHAVIPMKNNQTPQIFIHSPLSSTKGSPMSRR